MRSGSASSSATLRRDERAPGRRQLRLADGARDALAEHEALQQRVAGETIAAVQARCRNFAAGPEAGQRGRAARIRRDAAHVEMRRRRHWQRAGPGIDARRARDGAGARKSGFQFRNHRDVEQDARGRRAGVPRRCARQRPGRELRVAVDGRHEAVAGIVEQHGARPAQRFRQERQRIAADGERRRVELHELEVGEAHAAASGGGEARAPRVAGGSSR